MRISNRFTAAAAVLIGALVMAASASAKTLTETATAPLSSGGNVTAQLTYTPNPKADDDTNIALTITRAGTQLVSGPVKTKLCPEFCSVEPASSGASALHAIDLLGTGEPVVTLDLFTGGAHCCSVTEFYTYNAATNSYSDFEQDWGDPGYALKQMGGKYVFETNNDAFAYEFTAYAASGMPIELESFTGTKMVDITRNYPSLITKDAAFWLKTYKGLAKGEDGGTPWLGSTGIIAPWAADEDELGHSALVAKYLTAQAAAGHLQSGMGAAYNGTKFITRLNKFLKKEGYLK